MGNLASLIEKHRVIVVVGSGGVGKTTTSAALALHAAVHGRRTLCLTIDPAKRLANSLGLKEMKSELQLIEPERFVAQGLPCAGHLYTMMLNTKSTFDDLVERYASSEEVRDRILQNQIYQYVSSSLAGTQEYMAMEKLYEVRQNKEWQTIVLDTPPTANALDFLEAPKRLVDAIDSSATRWLAQVVQGVGKKSFGLAGTAATVLLRGVGRFTGLEFVEQVAAFVAGINDLFGGFKERAAEVASTLRSHEVAFVIVTSPEDFALAESRVFYEKLRKTGIIPQAMIINRVHSMLQSRIRGRETLRAELADIMPVEEISDPLLDALLQALNDEVSLATRDSERVKRVRAEWGNPNNVTEVPVLDQDVFDLKSLAEISSYLIPPAA